MTRPSPRGWFFIGLAATLVFRLWLSAAMPMTADEAYFVLWGRHPDLGYYDHPPMIGWWLAPLVALSGADWVARLPATLAPAAVALAVRAALARGLGRDSDTANLAALAILLAPINLWNVLVTTDAPLLVFSVASLLVFLHAVRRGGNAAFALAGGLLGFAFLSKYFAVLLGLAYLAWAAQARRWAALALVVAGALPAALVNLYWNTEACWCNVMFNAINRHAHAAWSPLTPPLYVAALAYLAAPVFWILWRERAALRALPVAGAGRALVWVWLLPLAVFALLSPVRLIGLHWLQWFLPALVMSAALVASRAQLERAVRCFAAFALLHLALAAGVAALPLAAWKQTPWYQSIVFHTRTRLLLDALAPERAHATLAADSYAAAAVLAYHSGRDVPVFGMGSSHARQDDILTDWRRYAGRDFLIVRRSPPSLRDYGRFFRNVEIDTLRLGSATFYAVRGRAFDYAAYRRDILVPIRARYYRIPRLLPVGRCYFFERYFSG